MTPPPVEYGSFGQRFGAYILDIVLIAGLSIGLQYLNFAYNNNEYAVVLGVAILGTLYKPLTESFFQATFGKWLFNLKVTDHQYKRIGLGRSLLRSLIVILPALVSLPANYYIHHNADLMEIQDYWNFLLKSSNDISPYALVSNLLSMIFFLDLIFLLTDGTNRGRSLKDRMAKTYVIRYRD